MAKRRRASSLPASSLPASSLPAAFDLGEFLQPADLARRAKQLPAGAVVFRQGEPAASVFYIRDGGIKLGVLSASGKEAVIGLLGRGDFFGEGCLASQTMRMGSASTTAPTTLLEISKQDMTQLLHDQPEFSNRFITHMLARNIRIEEDLVDQMFNSSEKRLARTLLLLARYGKDDPVKRVVPLPPQETLAEIVGTTRSRVNFFMNKFRKLGFIEYNGGLKINNTLLSVVLHD